MQRSPHGSVSALGGAWMEVLPGARTFSMIDRPDVLAELIGDFAGADAVEWAA